MGLTPAALLIILFIHVVIGTAIGSVVVFALLRRRTTWRLIVIAALVSTSTWLTTLHLSDLAGVSGFPKDGKWEVLTWRQNTPLQNFLGDHPYLISLIASMATAAVVITVLEKYWSRSEQI